MENKAKIDYHCLKCLILSQRCRTKFHAFETVGTGEPRILKESWVHCTSQVCKSRHDDQTRTRKTFKQVTTVIWCR